MDDVSKLYDEIIERLKDDHDLLNLFKNYDEKMNIFNLQSDDEFYLEGFRFGAQIGIDIMTEPKKQLHKTKTK